MPKGLYCSACFGLAHGDIGAKERFVGMGKENTQGRDETAMVVTTKRNGVTTLRMNNPKRLNGWTLEMMDAFKAGLRQAAEDDETKVVIFTGTGRYYSAGVNLGGTLKLGNPRTLHKMIVEHNQTLFETFLDFPKPILVAANGPAIGASVTSATLCDAIIAAPEATFSTPFASLGITPEGCSSIHFARIMGEENAERMLGKEGWKPTAQEALEAGFVRWVVPQEELLDEAQRIAEEWIEEGATRSFQGGSTLEELKEVNARESIGVADSFLSAPFMMGQARFLWGKGKRLPAMMFVGMRLSRLLWGWMMPRPIDIYAKNP